MREKKSGKGMRPVKKLFCLVVPLLFLAPAAVSAEENAVWKYDDLNMYLDLEGEVSKDVTVPSEIDGYEVKALGSGAFQGQHSVTSITLPDSIEALKSSSIGSMDGLEKVQLSENLAVIERGNFSSCPALTCITIPASVSYIDSSLYWCENLKEIRFEGVCPIFQGNDWNFDGLSEECVIYVPDDQLDAYAEALADVNGAADRLQPSGQDAVTVDFTAPEEDFAFDSANGTITGYTGSSARLEIPAEIDGVPVKTIGEDAFLGCYYIYYAVIPEGVETIGDRSFRQACNLGYISFPSTLKTIGEEAFFNAQAARIDWSEGLEEIGPRAFCYDSEAILTLPSTVRTIGEGAFEKSGCMELYLSGDLIQIDSRAFAGASLNYMAFDFYEPVDIASDAFAENYIKDLDLPWDSSFENRDAYAEMLREQCPDCTVWINNPISGQVAEYPENDPEVMTITDGVWTAYSGNISDLTVWTYYDNTEVSALGDGVFKGNQNIRSFYPHHCGWFTAIGNESFADSSVEYVELFGSVTTIGDGAFRNCRNITELTIPASVTSVGQGVLEGCTNLRKLTVLCDPSVLPSDFLTGCTGLEEIYAAADASNKQIKTLSTIAGRPWYDPVTREGETPHEVQFMTYDPLPGEDFWYDEEYKRLDSYRGYEVNLVLPREIDGVPLTMIGGGMMGRAAYGDDYEMELPVRSVVIPETYTEIPAFAFENCETLETVVCYAPVENLQEGTFSNCTSLREVIFVNGVCNLSDYVFKGCPNLETVYLGEYVEEVSEAAFLNEDGSSAYEPENCITSPDQMPDVDKLLEAVKSDPIPEPEVQSVNDEVFDDLSAHRQELLSSNSICGVIYLGYVDGGSGSYSYDRSCMEQVINDSGYLEEFRFLSDIPEECIVETEYGCELYCIYPYDPDAFVTVNEYVYDGEDDYIGRIGDILYRSEHGDPIILRCNVSDIIRDTQISIVDSRGSVLVWQPGISLRDGSVDVPVEEPYVYDATYTSMEDSCAEENYGMCVMQVVNCQEWVSLRQEPDVNSARIDMVPLGTILQNCYDAGNDFYYVEYNGLSGYVHSDFLTEIASSRGELSAEYQEEQNGYLFGMQGEWVSDTLVQENGTDMVYRLQFLTDDSGPEGKLTFSFDDPWSDSVTSWYGTYFALDPAENDRGSYMYFLDTPDGRRYGEIYVVLFDNMMTITEESGDAFWPFTSRSTETLWFLPY